LFRDVDGKPSVQVDFCIHRGTKLSTGKVVDGCIRCPYHGWTYNGAGHVVEIPSEGSESTDGQPIRSNLRNRTLPCVEQDGVIWVWMGAGVPTAPTPPWRFPNYQKPGWISYFMITDFENEVTNLAENFMDVPHTVFVHKGWFRNSARINVPMEINVGNGEVLVTYHQPNDSIGFAKRALNPKNEPMVHTDKFIFPNITRVDYSFGSSSAFVINSQCTPVSTMKSRVFTYIAYRLPLIGPLIKPFMRFYTRKVIQQDVDIMKNQGANLLAHEPKRFLSTDADEIHLAIEHLRRLGREGKPEVWSISKNRQKSFWI
jgi:phenylpropionate dioxygenase-like ring-hydroxylating dioxygenase large terminal subunit